MNPIKTVKFGRSSSNDVQIDDNRVSRLHCEIQWYGNNDYRVVDCNSTNGTWVNGQRIVGKKQIHPSDIVRIGNTTLRWMDFFRDDVVDYDDEDDDGKGLNGATLLTFFCGIISIGIIVYIVINYFTLTSSITKPLSVLGVSVNTIAYFPIYLQAMKGQWVLMIAALVIGVLSDLFDSFSENDSEGGLSSIGVWLGNTAATIASIFLLLAIFAPQMYN